MRIGLVLRDRELRRPPAELASIARAATAAGIDHSTVGDHVSFANGKRADGLIQAAVLPAADPSIEAGCRRFNTVPEADILDAATEAAGTLKPCSRREPH